MLVRVAPVAGSTGCRRPICAVVRDCFPLREAERLVYIHPSLSLSIYLYVVVVVVDVTIVTLPLSTTRKLLLLLKRIGSSRDPTFLWGFGARATQASIVAASTIVGFAVAT